MMGAPIHNVAYLYERKLSFTLLHLRQFQRLKPVLSH